MMSELEKLNRWLLGNSEAEMLCRQLANVSQVWDDLIDEGTADHRRINGAFWQALITIPSNLFYRAYFDRLQPILAKAVLDWWTANEIEASEPDETQLAVAYVLRDTVSSVVVQCALILGGAEWATIVNREVRAAVHDESLSDYRKSFAKPVEESA